MLDFLSVISLGATIVAIPFLLIGWSDSLAYPKESRPFPVKSTLLFVMPLAVGMVCFGISTSIAGVQVAEFLQSVSDKYTISIDGHIPTNRDALLNTLKSVAVLPAHHSSPTRVLRVDISDPPRHLQLWLARDSNNPREYWVFAPSPSKLAFRFSMKKDIGHIITPLFDDY